MDLCAQYPCRCLQRLEGIDVLLDLKVVVSFLIWVQGTKPSPLSLGEQ